MLQLQSIVKDYGTGDNIVHALKGINLSFRNNEFVSILGPSGCGKTTMLNIIGGLDRYSAGDLLINGKSTKDYTDYDWDTYRNKTIGFVFQTYNLIPHLTIQENVEMALSLAGVSKAERRERASEALTTVGLADKLKKKPSELSGGQMQRVAIARALVNNPSVVLADEPTGALDTDTGLQVMEVLKKVAEDRLVIMVTHNPQLAESYSTRIIKILDGQITDDSHPLSAEEVKALEAKDQAALEQIAALPKEEKKKLDRQSRMSLGTAFSLSYHNLLTKKKRSFITAFACSIGVIGMTVILSVSSGMQSYVDTTMAESAYANYVTISTNYVDLAQVMSTVGNTSSTSPEYPENTTGVTPYTPTSISVVKQNLNQEYLDYVESVTADKVVAVDYTYGVNVNALLKNDAGVYQFSSTSVLGTDPQ
jgi:putative ABC transport system permease protein